MVQSDQLTTNIPNNLPNSTEISQQDDCDYQDDREEYLYKADGTMDTHTPTDHTTDDKDTEPDNNVCKRERKTYTPADTITKDLTKQRQAQLLKNQQEKERAKAKALENRDKTDKKIMKPEHKSLQHSQKIIGIILMILIVPEHKSLKVKHLTLIRLRIPKRIKEPLEHIMMLGC